MNGLLTAALLLVACLAAGCRTSGCEVVLTWSAPNHSADPVAGYTVYRLGSDDSSGRYARINASLVTSTTYTDSAVRFGTTYTYYVTSVDAYGAQSMPCDSWSVRVPNWTAYEAGKHTVAITVGLAVLLLLVAGLVVQYRRTRHRAVRV